MKIISINVGCPTEQTYFNKKVMTGGHKQTVPFALLRLENLEGDAQADLKNHGGEDKAVCVYSYDHYPYWQTQLGVSLDGGAFSENLTVEGLRESDVCIGDIIRVGDALTQISQPRQPCSKLAGKFGRRDLPERIHDTGFSGFYLRVLSEGMVRQGDAFELLTRHSGGVTVELANQVMYYQRDDAQSLKRVLGVDALSVAWRNTLSKRL